MKLNLHDGNFAPDLYSARNGICNLLEWDRGCLLPGPIVFTDQYLNDEQLKYSGRKIAWLLEPIEINPQIYAWIRYNYRYFDCVFTHDDEILAALPNAHWVPMAGTWIPRNDRKIYDKTKLCSFVASSKNWTTGHRLRQEVRGRLPIWIEAYGKGFNYLESKTDCLKDYCFSIAIENCIRDTYFTEKLIDCFNTGTVPIYWGTRKLTKYFNEDGIIYFQTPGQLLDILNGLNVQLYRDRLDAVKDNFERAREFETGEHWIARVPDLRRDFPYGRSI